MYTSTDTGFVGMSTNPDTTFTVASTDYFALFRCIRKCNYQNGVFFVLWVSGRSSGTDVSGPWGAQATAPASHTVLTITDGTSNTLIIGEMSGRPWLFLTNTYTAVPTSSFPSYVTTALQRAFNIPLDYGFGAWAHNNNFNVGVWSRQWHK